MYKLLRNIHLILGLFSAVFLLAYALSAAQMAYPLYRAKPQRSTRTLDIPPEVDLAPRPLAKWLMDSHDLRGDLTEVDSASTSVALTIVRPGTTHRIELDPRARTATVTTGVLDAIGMLNRIHHVGGVAHEYWAINAWGWFLFAISIALVMLALSGTIMWFQRHRERRIGAILFAAGLLYGVTLLILVRVA